MNYTTLRTDVQVWAGIRDGCYTETGSTLTDDERRITHG